MGDDMNLGLVTPIILEPAPNGGWVISEAPDHPGMMRKMLGAFGDDAQMVDALRAALTVARTKPATDTPQGG